MSYVIELDHTTATGHRIPGHKDGHGKCARLHGHTYSFHVQLTSEVLEPEGFVVDYGEIKATLDSWDHRMLLWENDPMLVVAEFVDEDHAGVIRVPFIPTAENMAYHLCRQFLREFDQLVFSLVEVRESPLTVARSYCSQQDLRDEEIRAEITS